LETDKAGLLLQEVLDIEILNIEIVTASWSLTVPQKLSRADKSGLVFVAAHCKDPNYSSQSSMLPCGYFHLFMFSARPLHMNGIDGEEIILTHVKINCSFHLEWRVFPWKRSPVVVWRQLIQSTFKRFFPTT
jgi:hypothetical protein